MYVYIYIYTYIYGRVLTARRTYVCALIYIYMYMCTYMRMYIYIHMGLLRSVGSIKLYVSFAEYRLFYRALLQKRLIILSILLTEATPYMYRHSQRSA